MKTNTRSVTLAINLACLALLALVAGCASGPDFKTYTATLQPPEAGKSRVWFYRPSKMAGSMVQPMVNVNNVPLFKAQPGCFFYSDMAPGQYEVKCATEWADKGQLTVGENSPAYVRLNLLPGLFVGHILPKQVPEERALKEMQGLHLITANGANKDWKPAAAAATP